MTTFWHGRRVFITGHTGFKGSWLALWLTSLGAQVTGYSLTLSETEEKRFLFPTFQSIKGDIRVFKALSAAFAESAPEVVFHLAAQPLVRRSYIEPQETYETNVIGTVNVLEAARQHSDVRVLLIVTTDKCYKDQQWVWGYRETDTLGGYDPYSSSKACAELAAQAYRSSFFSTRNAPVIATVRAGNVIGGGDWAEDRLVPDMARAYVTGNDINIRNPRAVRPWQHVLDPLKGYLQLAEQAYNDASYGDAWNFGPSGADARSVAWVVENFIALWGESRAWKVDSDEASPHETFFLRLDSSKALTRLPWHPRLTTYEALQWTVDWYKRNAAGQNPVSLCLEQITEYAAFDPE